MYLVGSVKYETRGKQINKNAEKALETPEICLDRIHIVFSGRYPRYGIDLIKFDRSNQTKLNLR